MFKFIKELVDAAREGAAEAKTELAQENRDKEEAARQQNVEWEARLASTPMYEQFLVALGAPYKQTYTRELQGAVREERPAVFLHCMALPPDEKEATWHSMLDRDFSVTDEETLETTVEGIVGAYVMSDVEDEDRTTRALWMTRACYLITASAAVAFVSSNKALAMAEPCVRYALANYTGWEDYGRQFVEGEKNAPGTNVLGRKILKGSVESLLDNPRSPWLSLKWPQTPAEIDAIIGAIGNRPGDE